MYSVVAIFSIFNAKVCCFATVFWRTCLVFLPNFYRNWEVICAAVVDCASILYVCVIQIQNQMANLNISPAGYPVNSGMAAAADPYRLNWGSTQPTPQPYQMSANVNQ